MRFPTLKLGQQGIILVLVLLVLEFAFVCTYWSLLNQAEEESRRQQKQKEIIAKGSQLLQDIYDAGDAVGKFSVYRLHADERRYQTAVHRIPRTITWLRQELKGNESQLQRLVRIEQNVNVGLTTLSGFKEKVDRDPKYVIVLWQWADLQPRLQALVKDMKEFLQTERDAESRMPEIRRLQRQRAKDVLVIGGAVNIAFALTLALFFVIRLRTRLNVLTENSKRFRKGESLQAPLKGRDELAVLDGAFHKMVDSLRGEENLLRSSEHQVRSMIEQMPVGLMILSDDGEIDFSNPSIERSLHFSEGELIGRNIGDIFTCDVADEKSLFGWLSENSIGRVVELKGKKKDGGTLYAEYSMDDVSQGDVRRNLAMILDVSERVEMQKVRQAFVAMVSHELRTPLTSVGGFLQMFDMGMLGSVSEDLKTVVRQSQGHVAQLIALINDLLDLEKTEANKMSLSPTSCSLEDVIDAASAAIAKLLDEKKIRLHFEGSEVAVMVDREKTTRAVTNLLSGLGQLTEDRGAIEITAQASDDGMTLVTIAAKSVVIPEAQRDSMFERFQQVQINGKVHGLGLSFALSRAIVVGQGGSIGFESDEEEGSAVWLRLPVANSCHPSIQ